MTTDRLAKVFKGKKPERVREFIAKNRVISIRVSETDRVEMKRVAKNLHLTLSEYLLRLHYYAAETLERK